MAKSRKPKMTDDVHRPRGKEGRLHLPEFADAFELYDLEGNPIPSRTGR